MARYAGLVDVDLHDDVVDGMLAVAEEIDDAEPHGVGQGLEYGYMHCNVYVSQCMFAVNFSTDFSPMWNPLMLRRPRRRRPQDDHVRVRQAVICWWRRGVSFSARMARHKKLASVFGAMVIWIRHMWKGDP